MEIDTNLYSKQLGAYGMNTMKQIINLSVFIYGMRGVKKKYNKIQLGVEIAKNIILQGVKKITLYDNSLVTNSDLNSNFFCNKDDINKITRAEASKRGLTLLNNLAQINVFKGE